MNKNSSSIKVFMIVSLCLFVIPISLHAIQLMVPDFLPAPRYRNGTIEVDKDPFPPLQVALDLIFYALTRLLSLPIFYVFLYMLVFLSSEVEKFKHELKDRHYRTEDKARKRAIQLRELVKATEKAFCVFLVLYIVMFRLDPALEIFSMIEKVEKLTSGNHTTNSTPALTFESSSQTLDIGSQNNTLFSYW